MTIRNQDLIEKRLFSDDPSQFPEPDVFCTNPHCLSNNLNWLLPDPEVRWLNGEFKIVDIGPGIGWICNSCDKIGNGLTLRSVDRRKEPLRDLGPFDFSQMTDEELHNGFSSNKIIAFEAARRKYLRGE